MNALEYLLHEFGLDYFFLVLLPESELVRRASEASAEHPELPTYIP